MTAAIPCAARPVDERAVRVNKRDSADPCTLVILGGLGDLARRKLLPALYDLARDGLLDEHFAVLGVSRETGDDASFRSRMLEAAESSDEIHGFNGEIWTRLSERLHYTAGDLTDAAAYAGIARRLAGIEAARPDRERNRMFYFAVPPSVFVPIVRHLSASGLAPRTRNALQSPWARVVVEKPFGRSLETACELNQLVLSLFAEHQVYRIDHYLGKETVQNLLVLRFANTIFEPLWNRQWISQVQITAAETLGVETRGKYYEEAGVVRDMFQNHLLQLLTLTAMEPPFTMRADAVRDEKVKVLNSVRWLDAETILANAVRGQYTAGSIKGQAVRGYREEPNVAPDSLTPTYAAVRLFVDNWRWEGVPFFLRSGKRLTARASEIAVQFRSPPRLMFGRETAETMRPNELVLRVQPNDGVALRFEVKVPGTAVALTSEVEVAPVEMDFSYATAFGEGSAPAYGTLLLDAMIGEATLFTRSDEVESAWKVIDPLVEFWERAPRESLALYPAGSWGPLEANALIQADGFSWRVPASS